MKLYFKLLILLLSIVQVKDCFSQVNDKFDSPKNIVKAYFYLLGQKTTLKYYIEKDPGNKDLLLLNNKEESYFGQARSKMKAYLVNKVGAQDLKKQEEIAFTALDKLYNQQSLNYDNLKNDLNGRINGMKTLPEDIKLTTLSFKYQGHLNSLISDGFYNIYNSKGHPKSKGIDFSIKIPVLFEIVDGDRPNVLNNFKTSIDENFMNFNIGTVNVPELGNVTQKDVNELIKSARYKSMIDKNAQNVEAKPIFIEDLNGLKISYNLHVQRLDLSLDSYMIQYMLFLKGKMMTVTFGIQKNEDVDYLKFNAYVTSIMNTFILNSNYK